jgi:HK97 family phage major capsid protein
MQNVFELKKQRAFAQAKAERIIAEAESAKRGLTDAESGDIDMSLTAVNTLTPQIEKLEKQSTLRLNAGDGKLLISGGAAGQPRQSHGPFVLSDDYQSAFYDYIGSNGQKVNAALYEGSNPAGGYVVPVVVDQNIVPLAPTDMGVREVATVLATATDIKVPRVTAISTATAKAEGTGSGSNLFTESEPTLDQFTLSAFMAGVAHYVSWELAQDVPSFNAFAVQDMLLAQNLYEENLFVNGTGTGQAQGLIGNTGTGITGVAAGSDTYASELLDATFGVMGSLKTQYFANASWLMSRATSIVLRKAQKNANLFEPVFTTSNGIDYLHGRKVVYSTAMPTVATTHTPILFGDFKQGYVIGDRGGSGISVKILDQPKAMEGLLILLAYRRTDGRVRRSEAIQAITLA